MVTAAAVALLASVVGLAAVLIVQTQAKADLSRSLSREKRATRGPRRGELGAGALQGRGPGPLRPGGRGDKTFHTGVSEDFLLKEDQFKDLRDRLLEVGQRLLRQARRAARQGIGRGLAAGAVYRRTSRWPN